MAGLLDEGFEEVSVGNERKAPQGAPQGQSGPQGTENRPDLRVVQVDVDKDGKTMYKNIGGMWKNVSKNGNEFYTLKIGQLKLLVFPNNQKGKE